MSLCVSKTIGTKKVIGILMKFLVCVASRMIHFSLSSRSHPYTVISPLTPLEELEEFFRSRRIDFALGELN